MGKNEILNYFLTKSDLKVKKHLSQRGGTYKIMGVSMGNIRHLAKKIGQDVNLATTLYETHIFEAMMLSTMIMPPSLLNLSLLTLWAKQAESSQIIDQGLTSLILKVKDKDIIMRSWYLDTDEHLRYAGYAILSSYFRNEDLNQIDIPLGNEILERIKLTIASEPLTIQNAMNNAVVMAGLHVPLLVEKATEVALHIGHVMPLVALNQCNIQSAYDYIIRYKDNPTYSRVARIKSLKS
jgi:3-methyladenine DNA glycosylase AlkD